jgi:glycosyltransferase involved in cell wall biosynthesis
MERLARRHDVHAFALRHEPRPATYRLAGATVHDLGGFRERPGPGVFWLFPALIRALRRAGPFDVMHGYVAALPGALAALAGRLLSIPTVVTIADGELIRDREAGYGLQLRWQGRAQASLALRFADLITARTSFAAGPVRALGFDAKIVPHGVDVAVFQATAAPAGPPYRLVQVATLNRVKDQVTLLRALRLLSDRGVPFHLDLVGEDTLGGAVQRECARLELDSRVRFHGFQPTDRVRKIVQEAHLYVQSSRHEAGGVAVLEAAACAVPTVGTRVGHVADWAPERARAVAVGDAPALAEAVWGVLRDETLRQDLGRRAREWARRTDADRVASLWEEVYEETRQRRAGGLRA